MKHPVFATEYASMRPHFAMGVCHETFTDRVAFVR